MVMRQEKLFCAVLVENHQQIPERRRNTSWKNQMMGESPQLSIAHLQYDLYILSVSTKILLPPQRSAKECSSTIRSFCLTQKNPDPTSWGPTVRTVYSTSFPAHYFYRTNMLDGKVEVVNYYVGGCVSGCRPNL